MLPLFLIQPVENLWKKVQFSVEKAEENRIPVVRNATTGLQSALVVMRPPITKLIKLIVGYYDF